MRPIRDQESIGAGVISPSAMRETIAQLVRRVFRAHAASDIHRTACQEFRPFRGAPPEHQPLPFRAALLGLEMATDDGVDAVRANKDVRAHSLAAYSRLRVGEVRNHPALVLHETLQPEAGAHRAGTEFGDDFVVDRLLQTAAMDRELRIVETGVDATQFGPHLLAKSADVVKFLGADAGGVEPGQEIERSEFLDGVRENVDADTDLPDLGGLFENDAFDAPPMKHEREGQSTEARTRNEHFHGS